MGELGRRISKQIFSRKKSSVAIMDPKITVEGLEELRNMIMQYDPNTDQEFGE